VAIARTFIETAGDSANPAHHQAALERGFPIRDNPSPFVDPLRGGNPSNRHDRPNAMVRTPSDRNGSMN